MKKFLLLLTCVCMVVSCSEDEQKTSNPTPPRIIGEWVFDDPENGIWEKQKFLSNMKFYLSYMTMFPYTAQENAEGSYYYTSDNSKITFSYQNVLGGITYQDAVIEEINDWSYTASYYNDDNTFTGRYTYHKLLDVEEMPFGESCIPQYDSLISDVTIKGFKSNNEDIAIVNPNTGEITAGSTFGRTYVNVITDEGIAYIEVNVKDPENLFPDYSPALNMNEKEVKKQWPDFCVYGEPVANCIHYPIIASDYAEMAMIWLDDDKNVESVQLSVNTTAIDEAEREKEIHKYLSTKYEYISSESGIYMYFDLSNPQELPMAIYYSPELNLIEYQKIILDDLWEDYTLNFGKSSADLIKIYGAPVYQTTTNLFFTPENDYVENVVFSLTDDKVYAASIILRADCDWQEALNFLNRKYYYFEEGSDASNNSFAFMNKKTLTESSIGIIFDGKEGIITYVDLTANVSSSETVQTIAAETRGLRTVSKPRKPLAIYPKLKR